jgi:hypothetical protein
MACYCISGHLAGSVLGVDEDPLRLASEATRVSDAKAGTPAADLQICTTCGEAVPTRTLLYHACSACVRNNWICPVCSVVVRLQLKHDDWHRDEPGCGEAASTGQREKHLALKRAGAV